MKSLFTPSGNVYEVHLEDFDTKVLQVSHKHPVLLDFWAEWCSPCVFIDPLLKEVVAESAGRLVLAKLEVDEGDNMKVAGQYQVRGFPTVILFCNGKIVDRFSGARSKAYIESFLERNCGLAPI